MSSRKSVTMLTSTGSEFEVTGKAIRADGYFGHTDGKHTVQVNYSNLTGAFSLQATLALEPEESDWFDIHLNKLNSIDPLFYANGESGVKAFTFTGNFTYIRARLLRSYIQPEPLPDAELGSIDKVLLSM